MTLLCAATSTEGDSTTGKLILAGLALLWTVGYLIACLIWPLKACRKCAGNGKIRSPSGRAWRRCPRCKGAGGRLRLGHRIAAVVFGRRRDAS